MLPSNGRAFVGDIANPITEARLSISMTLNSLAKRLGLSRQYVSRAEQGTYTTLNPALTKWVAEISNISRKAVVERYLAFQSATRKVTAENVSPEPLHRRSTDNRPGYEIFTAWREGYWPSVIAFCNALCVHPETVNGYEEGQRPQMPEPIRRALSEVELIDANWTDQPPRAEALRDRLTA